MFHEQGCDALSDLYFQAADELSQQIVLVGIGGLTGWEADAVEVPATAQPRRFGPGAAHGDDPALNGANPYRPTGGNLYYHGADVKSLVGILNKGLDASEAAANYTDGPGGFFLATHYGDAEYFALRSGSAPGIIKVKITDSAIVKLQNAGAVTRKIPETPKSPKFEGYEFHIPNSAFPLFNQLRRSGEIEVSP
ncbi:hypothetical protein [Streptomyces sp. PsTaAH-124]|uniref:hypothetical protein n=1 Tax=Streptomyces sp. PsTaAH-124 TaxID=1157638 RepID=UPI001F2D731B|nr:hypothetical protein [Streptomyces sp. PsTaAH-124]